MNGKVREASRPSKSYVGNVDYVEDVEGIAEASLSHQIGIYQIQHLLLF